MWPTLLARAFGAAALASARGPRSSSPPTLWGGPLASHTRCLEQRAPRAHPPDRNVALAVGGKLHFARAGADEAVRRAWHVPCVNGWVRCGGWLAAKGLLR